MKTPHWKIDPITGNLTSPTGKRFADRYRSSDSIYSLEVSPEARTAYSASLANGATLTCDFPVTTINTLERILYLVRVGDFAFDCTALAKCDAAGVATLRTPNPKPIFTAADYTSPPSIALTLSISGTNARLSLQNNSGSAQVVAMAATGLRESIA